MTRRLALVLLLAIPRTAAAEPRPDEGGLWSFDRSDLIQFHDDGPVRVHYSVDGPNRTLLTDVDGDTIPDYAQDVAATTIAALALYTGELGLRAPVPETRVGDPLGGSEAIDVYLVDFGGAADGRFGIDACTTHCAGFLVVENDFAGYGYPSRRAAIDTVVSHELFHAVQAAYAELPVWASEGTATWAERQYDPASADFLGKCNGYLAETSRPIYAPPPGPVPAFAYGSALFWDFLSIRHDASIVAALLEAVERSGDPPELAVIGVLEERDDSLEQAWPEFARWNLATGFRSGVATSYAYADRLDAILPDHEGDALDLDARLYPLAASYLRLDHGGGTLHAGADAGLPGVAFSLHPVAEFAEDGAVGDAIATFTLDAAGTRVVYEALPPGGYFVVVAYADVADATARARVCIGDEAAVAPCHVEGEEDSSGSESGTTLDVSSSTTDGGEASTDGDDPDAMPSADGCGCRSGAPSPGLVGVALAMVRRRRSRSR